MVPAALKDRIILKSLELGADDAGVCRAAELLTGPTHGKFPLPEGIEKHHSILVLALNHSPDEPELDYFIKRDGAPYGNSEGNRRLMDISGRIGQWMKNQGIESRDLHYYVERGGVFLKGAAVLAGLGAIGVNNLLIHPGYGARIRFRAHLVDAPLAPSEPLDFAPCRDCDRPCLAACPEDAFDKNGYVPDRCQDRMDRDLEQGVAVPADNKRPAGREARYCRACEMACSYRGSKEE
jgi:epoxyqueuosine reductase